MRTTFALAAWLAVATLGSCREAATPFAATHEITTETEYYKAGPQQAMPPDGKFQAGTKVKMVREEGSYVIVQTEEGEEVYVASNSLKPIEGYQ